MLGAQATPVATIWHHFKAKLLSSGTFSLNIVPKLYFDSEWSKICTLSRCRIVTCRVSQAQLWSLVSQKAIVVPNELFFLRKYPPFRILIFLIGWWKKTKQMFLLLLWNFKPLTSQRRHHLSSPGSKNWFKNAILRLYFFLSQRRNLLYGMTSSSLVH